jgi:hypothetical protein
MSLSAAFAALALAATAPAAPREIGGDYIFEGSCPTVAPAYRGRLTIRREGIFHTMTWTIGAGTLVGRGLMSGRRMAVEFRDVASGDGGLMEMRRRGRHWRGVWAYRGYGEVCTETWTPA